MARQVTPHEQLRLIDLQTSYGERPFLKFYPEMQLMLDLHETVLLTRLQRWSEFYRAWQKPGADAGWFYHTVDALCQELVWHKDHMKRTIAKLRRHSWMEIEARTVKGSDKPSTVTHFRIRYDLMEDALIKTARGKISEFPEAVKSVLSRLPNASDEHLLTSAEVRLLTSAEVRLLTSAEVHYKIERDNMSSTKTCYQKHTASPLRGSRTCSKRTKSPRADNALLPSIDNSVERAWSTQLITSVKRVVLNDPHTSKGEKERTKRIRLTCGWHPFGVLRRKVKNDDLIQRVLDWHCAHMGEKGHFRFINSSKSFVKNFHKLESAMLRDQERNPTIEISNTAREIVEELTNYPWPKGAEECLPAAVQMSINDFQSVRNKIRDLRDHPERIKDAKLRKRLSDVGKQDPKKYITPGYIEGDLTRLLRDMGCASDVVQRHFEKVRQHMIHFKEGNVYARRFKIDNKFHTEMRGLCSDWDAIWEIIK